jgi:hypothetical protein
MTGLQSRYGETQQVIGTFTEDGATGALTLTANAATGTWTLLEVNNDIACVKAAGFNYSPVMAPPVKQGPRT